MTTPYNIALLAKEAGYDRPCEYYYYTSGIDDNGTHLLKNALQNYNDSDDFVRCSAPSLHDLAEWLRETHGLHVYAAPHASRFWYAQIYENTGTWKFIEGITDGFPTHDTALTSGIQKALEIVKERKS